MQEDFTISIPKRYLHNYDDFDKLSLSDIEKRTYENLNNSSLKLIMRQFKYFTIMEILKLSSVPSTIECRFQMMH